MERRLEITIRPELGGDAEYRYRELQRMGDALVTAGAGLYNEAINQLVEHRAETDRRGRDDELEEITNRVATLVEDYAASSDRTIAQVADELKETLFGYAKIPEPTFGEINLEAHDPAKPGYALIERTPQIEELLRHHLEEAESHLAGMSREIARGRETIAGDLEQEARYEQEVSELRRALGEPTRGEELMGDHPDAP